MGDFDEVGDLRRRVAALEGLIQRIIYEPSLRTEISKGRLTEAIEEQLLASAPIAFRELRKETQPTIYRQIRQKTGVELRTWLSVQSLGLTTDEVPLPRFFPIRLYIDSYDEDKIRIFLRALRAFLKAFEVDITDEFTPAFGSYLQSFIGRFKKNMSSAEAQDRFSKMERAMELQALGRAQAEIDRAQAESVAALINACGNVDDVSVQAGSILFEKMQTADGKIIIRSRTLSQGELIEIERRGRIYADGTGRSNISIDDQAGDVPALFQARNGNANGDK